MRILVVFLALASSGCAGLTVSWNVNASYNSNQQVLTQSLHRTNPTNEK